MDKTAVLNLIISALQTELAAAIREAQGTIDEATHPDNKAENKYDTRSLEASYLARGQSLRVGELEESVGAFQVLSIPGRSGGSVVTLGSLIEVEGPEGRPCYFIGPSAGGTEVVWEGREILVLTPGSPLGGRFLGKRAGEMVAAPSGRAGLRILNLW